MFADFASLTPHERYKLLIASVIPRPIALVTSQSADGVMNAAPYSFFNVLSEDPALAVLGLEAKRGSDKLKDTTRNVEATGELVINLVGHDLVGPMAACAANLPPEGDELDFAGLTPLPSKRVSVPGIAEAPIRLECKLFEMRAITPRRHLCIAEVLALSAQEGIFDPETHHVDLSAYRPIGRLYGDSYAELNTPFEVPVPPAPKEAS
jgi:flavin reductase (DIM6/NTAB) family NADH-FMN oxidoreductase RutF